MAAAVVMSPANSLRLKPLSATVRFISAYRKALFPISPKPHHSFYPLIPKTPIPLKFNTLISAALSSGEAIEKQKADSFYEKTQKVGDFRRRLKIADIKGGPNEGLDKLGQFLAVKGWVRTLRVQSSVTFIEVFFSSFYG